jgi:hypothetical protein
VVRHHASIAKLSKVKLQVLVVLLLTTDSKRDVIKKLPKWKHMKKKLETAVSAPEFQPPPRAEVWPL